MLWVQRDSWKILSPHSYVGQAGFLLKSIVPTVAQCTPWEMTLGINFCICRGGRFKASFRMNLWKECISLWKESWITVSLSPLLSQIIQYNGASPYFTNLQLNHGLWFVCAVVELRKFFFLIGIMICLIKGLAPLSTKLRYMLITCRHTQNRSVFSMEFIKKKFNILRVGPQPCRPSNDCLRLQLILQITVQHAGYWIFYIQNIYTK